MGCGDEVVVGVIVVCDCRVEWKYYGRKCCVWWMMGNRRMTGFWVLAPWR